MRSNTSNMVSDVWFFNNSLNDVGVWYVDFEEQLNLNKMDEAKSQSLQQSETLRQSILKRAFEGKLK
jgi:hypothetical protein